MADRSWMYLENRACNEYLNGVLVFIAAAEEDMKSGKKVAMCCPCYDCKNGRSFEHSMHLHAHLIMRGFKENYKCWNKHGEEGVNPGEIDQGPPGGNAEGQHLSDDDILGIHDDYGDLIENVDQMMLDAKGNDEYVDGEFKGFEELVHDSKKPLYPGCDQKLTRLYAVLKLLQLKASHCWSDRSFTALLHLLGELLPKEHELPENTYDAKKIICPLGLEVEKIHACKEDCILYRGEFADLTECPECGTSRYKRRNDWGDDKVASKRKGPPRKVVWYFPIIPRLKRLFANKKEAQLLRWHKEGRKNDGNLRHPADSAQWRNIDAKYRDFAQEMRNIRFAMSTDGMNPFGDMSTSHSTWPVLLTIFNLPPWLCNKRKYIMLSVLISGPRQPGINIDVYLRPLVDDLKGLWSDGVEVWDQCQREYFQLRAMLFCTIQDLPALYAVSGQCKGGKGCPQCLYDTESVWLNNSKKTVYMRHRQSGEITFYSEETKNVSERIIECSQDSSCGVRENDALNKALGNPEHTGRVRGVSSSAGWKFGWPEHRAMYKKRKRSEVDVDKLTETITAQVTQDVMARVATLLASQGIQFELPTPATVSPADGHKSSCASAGASGREPDLYEEMMQATAHEPEPDTIDLLSEPTPCSLMIILGGYDIEVARGLVYPQQLELHTVPIRDDFAVVFVDHANSDYHDWVLEVPPNDEITTLGQAQLQRIQWRRMHIVVRSNGEEFSGPSGASPSVSKPLDGGHEKIDTLPEPPKCNQHKTSKKSSSTKYPEGSQGKPPKKASPPKSLEGSQQKHAKETSISKSLDGSKEKHANKGDLHKEQQQKGAKSIEKCSEKDKADKTAKKLKGAKSTEQKLEKPAKSKNGNSNKQVQSSLTTVNQKFKFGQPMMRASELQMAGACTVELHNYYVTRCREKKSSFTVFFQRKHFLTKDDYFIVTFASLYGLFNIDRLDMSLLRCFTLYMILETKKKSQPVGFLDPQVLSLSSIEDQRDYAKSYVARQLSHYAASKECEYVMVPYNDAEHWILVLICLKRNLVLYLDSAISENRDFSILTGLLDEAFETFIAIGPQKKRQGNPKLRHETKFPCHQQPSSNVCGFYVAHHMLCAAAATGLKNTEDLTMPNGPIEYRALSELREDLATFLVSKVISSTGEFHCPTATY
ncbi:hypothetical protein ACP70R_007493 [Stipagrostis hirtigluma subsp. patula]